MTVLKDDKAGGNPSSICSKGTATNLCYLSKNLFDFGLYTVSQYFFQEQKYLSYELNYHLCKENENYQLLATDCGQQTLKYVDRCFQAFFKLLFTKQEAWLSYRRRNQLNDYLNQLASLN